jgi:hypothetical protein
LYWSGRRDSNSRPHAPQTGNVTVRLLRYDDVNQHLRGSQLILLCAYARLKQPTSIQDSHNCPHIIRIASWLIIGLLVLRIEANLLVSCQLTKRSSASRRLVNSKDETSLPDSFRICRCYPHSPRAIVSTRGLRQHAAIGLLPPVERLLGDRHLATDVADGDAASCRNIDVICSTENFFFTAPPLRRLY